MEHAETLELIELAAVEPDGLGRLMAGDTPEAAAVAGHLAGCPACAAELGRIGRTAALAREAIAAVPDPALRDRTLAYVRELGRDRSAQGLALVPDTGPAAATAAGAPVAGSPAASRPDRRRWLRVAGLAAALAIGVGVGAGAALLRSPVPQLTDEVDVLQATTEATIRVESQPDARRIPLTGTDAAAGAVGTLVYSPSTGELVMVATGLAPLDDGDVYGCWIDIDGDRSGIGRMYPGGDLHAWAGPVDGLAELPADASFGVSLVPADGSQGTAVLTGS